LLGTLDSGLLWQLGAYYLNENGQQQFAGTVPALSTDPAFDEEIDNETNSYAVYGEATYQVTETLSVTGGVRWTEDKKTYSDDCVGGFCQSDDDPSGSNAASVALKDSWDEVTYKLGFDYQLTDDHLL